MQFFLKEIIHNLYEKKKENLSDCVFIVPNKRAALFASRYLSELIDKPSWSPEFFTINEFITNHTSKQLADNLLLCFELYNSYVAVFGDSLTFSDFYSWALILLADFNDVDKYLVNANDIFCNIKDLKMIDDEFSYLSPEQIEIIRSFWQHFNPETESYHKKMFTQLWEKLVELYDHFHSRLEELGIAYEGMAYRDFARSLENDAADIDLSKHYVIIGLNALNPVETALCRWLKKSCTTDFYWDYDEYYVNNDIHEAGRFLRQNLRLFEASPLNISFNNLRDKNKKIEIISTPTTIGQAKVLDYIFSENKPDENNTAIVLADEELLMPVINSLPDTVAEVNITMGYPLKYTPMASLLELIVQMQINLGKQEKEKYYYKDILGIIHHQYLYDTQSTLIIKIEEEIRKKNRFYLMPEDFHDNEMMKLVFRKIEQTKDIGRYFSDLLFFVMNNTVITLSELDKEYMVTLYTTINRFDELIEKFRIALSSDLYWKLLRSVIQTSTVPFTGEPLAGLQVMGLLETRALDFTNVIILSLNEGKLPKKSVSPSFIPYNIRKGFGLPTIEHQDAIFSYYFYRLLQRAENITILYSSGSDGMEKAEMSRFLYQMKFDPVFSIFHKRLAQHIHVQKPVSIVVEKKGEVFQQLKNKLTQNGLSASSLNYYIDCPLKFYFSFVLEMKESEKITDEIQPQVLGTMLHHCANLLYKPLLNQPNPGQMLKKIKEDDAGVDAVIREAFASKFFFSTSPQNIEFSGISSILYEIIKRYLRLLFNVDEALSDFSLTGLEKYIEITKKINNIEIKLKGIIDRVDIIENNKVRIIDYKTGGDQTEFSSQEELVKSQEGSKRNKAAFQLMFYSYLYKEKEKNCESLVPGLYIFRKMANSSFSPYLVKGKEPIHEISSELKEFEGLLQQLLEEISSDAVPFIQTEDAKMCVYCPYQAICHKN